jgi:hypothetical protein
MRRNLILVAALAALSVRALGVEAEYRHPVVAIPYAATKPVIDGVVDDAEWQGAMSHRALQTTGKAISSRQARFWMMWDEENLYVAMRDPLRPGERPIQEKRGRGRDLETIFDDCYEIWVSVGATDPLTGQLGCMSQFVANYAGARYDVLHQPAVGNSRSSSYDTGWEPKNRITGRNEWEMEVVIPRASLGLTKGPFRDGQHFRCLIARNYKRPWEQNSFEGTSTFAVPDSHSEFIMSKTAPALHLLGMGDVTTGQLGVRLAAQGQADTAIRWKYVSPAVTNEGSAEVRKGVYREVANLPALDVPGPGKSRLTVTGADGAVLLDWSALRAFGPVPKDEIKDTGDRLDLRVTLNPEKDYVRVFGDLINYDDRAAIKDIRVVVSDATGKELKRSTAAIDADAFARDVIRFDALPAGDYKVRLDCLGAAGQIVVSKDSAFTKKDLAKEYAWWKTPRGDIEKVISPWTPVTLKDGVFGVWGREMAVGPAGLPGRVSTQGKPILAAPGRLVARDAAGRELVAEGESSKVLFDKDHRKTVRVESTLGDIAVSSDVTVEFDGLYKVAMTLTPTKATAVKSLQIVLPYAEAMAGYVHAVTAEIRSGYWYGFTPAGTGRVWDCYQLGDKSMKLGSFIPYIWLGSPAGGLCWFADSDEGWSPTDSTPAIEIRRDRAGQVDLVFNLVSGDVTLDAPRTITFGLQASPVKALHKGWREDNWWTGDTFMDYGGSGSLIWSAIPFVKPGKETNCQALVEAQHRAGKPAVPYFIHTSLPASLVPEITYFGEQWKTTVDEALCYRGSLIDYMVHQYGGWAESCGIDGYYIDNMRPLVCDNIEHGCGYRLPDGRIQPSFQMFDTRRYFLRLRAAFLEQRPRTRIVLHMTNAQILPWVGSADIAYDGEHHVIYPEMKKDFMDFWSLERLRVDYPAQWGVAVNFMQEYQGQGWDPAVEHNAFRAYFAAVMLHDALPTGNGNGHERFLVAIRKKFGIGDDAVSFLPYWEKTGLAAADQDIKLAGWLKPDKLLLLVANFGEAQTASVTLDPAALGWGGSSLAVTDAELGYTNRGYRTVPKTVDELKVERDGRAAKEAFRVSRLEKQYASAAAAAEKAGKPAPARPDLTPPPFKEALTRRETVVYWTGDAAPPPRLEGATLAVPVARHNYRLLIVERK